MTVPKVPLHERLLTEAVASPGKSGHHAASISLEGQTPPPRLPVFVRFPDLVAANIARNWPQLLRLIENEDFPRGVRLSPNARAWPIAEVQAWLASRPQAGQRMTTTTNSGA